MICYNSGRGLRQKTFPFSQNTFMNIPFVLAFILMGFTFTIIQVMVIRELLVIFVGNELSIAIILANWLLLEAAGSFLLGKRAKELGLGRDRIRLEKSGRKGGHRHHRCLHANLFT